MICSRAVAPPIKRGILLCGALPLLAALVLSYSRASLVSLVTSLAALLWLSRRQTSWRRLITSLGIACVAAYVFLVGLFPNFAEAYWMRLSDTFEFFRESPNAILSGRLHSWEILGDFLITHPWHAVLGIGYKSLPYTDFTGCAHRCG